MIEINHSLLQQIGLGTLPDVEKNSLLKHIYETLEMRVGIRLADQMSNEQLDEFERYFEAKDDEGAFKWLESNFPNYKDIVQEEFDKLKAEVAQSAPQILSAGQQTQTQQVAQQSQPVQQQQQQTLPQQDYPQATPVNSPAPNYAAPQPNQQPQYSNGPANPNQAYSQPPQTQQQQVTPQVPAYDPQNQQSQQQTQQSFNNPPIQQPPYPDQQPPAGPQPSNY